MYDCMFDDGLLFRLVTREGLCYGPGSLRRFVVAIYPKLKIRRCPVSFAPGVAGVRVEAK